MATSVAFRCFILHLLALNVALPCHIAVASTFKFDNGPYSIEQTIWVNYWT
jgi:hypothetical protein